MEKQSETFKLGEKMNRAYRNKGILSYMWFHRLLTYYNQKTDLFVPTIPILERNIRFVVTIHCNHMGLGHTKLIGILAEDRTIRKPNIAEVQEAKQWGFDTSHFENT